MKFMTRLHGHLTASLPQQTPSRTASIRFISETGGLLHDSQQRIAAFLAISLAAGRLCRLPDTYCGVHLAERLDRVLKHERRVIKTRCTFRRGAAAELTDVA